MGAKLLDGIPLAAIGVEFAPPQVDLPLWYVPPEARRGAWRDGAEPVAEEELLE